MSNNQLSADVQLPLEIMEEIERKAIAASEKEEAKMKHLQPNYDYYRLFAHSLGYRKGYIASAIAYESKITQIKKERDEFKKELSEKQYELLREIGEYNSISKELQQWNEGKEVEDGG